MTVIPGQPCRPQSCGSRFAPRLGSRACSRPETEYERLALTAASWGERWDSNPRHPGPQPSAPGLKAGHQSRLRWSWVCTLRSWRLLTACDGACQRFIAPIPLPARREGAARALVNVVAHPVWSPPSGACGRSSGSGSYGCGHPVLLVSLEAGLGMAAQDKNLLSRSEILTRLSARVILEL